MPSPSPFRSALHSTSRSLSPSARFMSMTSTPPQLPSPPGSTPPSFHPIDIKDSQPSSVAEPTGGKKADSHPKPWPQNFLRRRGSSASVNNQCPPRRSTSPPSMNTDCSLPWVQHLDRSSTTGNVDRQSKSHSLIEVATRLMGVRRRRNSDSIPPSASTDGQEPVSPRATSSVVPRGTTITPYVPYSLVKDLCERPRILFYHKHQPHYGFTNFSSHPVKYEGKVYPTSEHLFQSFKACRSDSPHDLL